MCVILPVEFIYFAKLCDILSIVFTACYPAVTLFLNLIKMALGLGLEIKAFGKG